MAYRYVAYDSRRKVVRGSINATTERVALDGLQQAGYTVLSLKPSAGMFSLRRQIPTLFGVGISDVTRFSRMLATLLARGTPTDVALQMLRDHQGNQTFREIIDEILEGLRQGRSFSDTLAEHPDTFPELYRRMVGVAEHTGRLDDVLGRLANHMEKEQALASKVRRALMYPAVIVVVAVGVIVLLVTFTLPSLATMFEEFGADIPWSTKLLVGLTNFVSAYKILIGAAAVGMVVMGALVMKLEGARQALDAWLLKIPIIGTIVQLREMTGFSRTVSTGLSASLPMPETMELAHRTAGNRVLAKAFAEVKGEVLRGRTLSKSLARNPIFSRPLVQIVRVGEESGTLDEDLMALAETYESEVDKGVASFVSLLEPALMVAIGVIVAFVAVSVVLPTYSIYGSIE